jgi:flagellar hook protein FlgE
MADFSIPLAGMSQASSNFDQAAARIARSPLCSTSAQIPGDTVDLSHEMVALLQAKNDFEANTKTVRVIDDMARSTLDMIR